MADPHTRVYRKGVLEAEGFPDVDASRIAVPTLITGYYGMNAPYPDSAALRRHRVAGAHRDDVRDCSTSCSGERTGSERRPDEFRRFGLTVHD
jgi:hypothetical protein